ncbi:MAG: hypothetical protein AAFY56_05935 [Pseudomonadota bacterium]
MIKSSADKATSLETGAENSVRDGVRGFSDLELGSSSNRIVLALEDFVANAAGEVVVFNDSVVATMVLVTKASVLGQGLTEKAATVDGQPIADFRFLAFNNGVTVFYPQGLEILVQDQSD